MTELKENFSINPLLESLPIIGPFFKTIFGCFSWKNIIVSLIPLIALFMRNGNEDFVATLIVIAIFYVCSIIGAVVLQYWKCSDSPNEKKKNFWDKIVAAAEGTWFIPMMFSIFMIINFIIRLPIFIELEEITLLLTFFIQNGFIFGIVMFFISWVNYCAFGGIVCN
tara:strand:+ start:310 stop:810 length:501 start_codon:yes stop_codon:yes gene_type:complete